MKTLLKSFAILAASISFGCSTGFREDNKLNEAVTIGADFKEAESLLVRRGIHKEERYYSIEYDPDYTTTYHPLRSGLDLVISAKKSSGKISFLWVMTTPKYRPTKALEVYVPISSISVAADGSFEVRVPSLSDDEQTKKQNKSEMATPRKPSD